MRTRPFIFILFLSLFSPFLTHAASIEEILKTLETSLAEETHQVQNLEISLTRQREEAALLEDDIQNYRLLIVSSQNLLLAPGTTVADLDKARANQEASLANIEARIRSITQSRNASHEVLLQAEEQVKIATEQLETLEAGGKNQGPEIMTIVKHAEKLLGLVKKKVTIVQEGLRISDNQIRDLSGIQTEITTLSEKLQNAQQDRKASELFERKGSITDLINPSNFLPDLLHIRDSLMKLFKVSFWGAEAKPLLNASPGKFIRILIISLFLIFVIIRTKIFFRTLARTYQENWRGVFFEMTSKSIILLILALFAEFLYQTQTILAGTEFFKMLTNLLWAFAVYRILAALLKAFRGENRPHLTEKQRQVLRGLNKVFGFFAPALVFSTWLMGFTSPVITVIRIAMWIFVLFLVFRFWANMSPEEKKEQKFSGKLLRILSKTVAVGAPLLELFGYGSLALFWFWGLGTTILSIAFYFMLLAVIHEWAKAPVSPEEKNTDKNVSFRDLLIKTLPILLLPIPILSLAIAWGLQGSLLPSTMGVLTYPVTIGDMKFSILNGFKAALALFLTLLFNHGLGFFLQKRVFSEGRVEKGLQASILTLLTYFFWVVGILIALRILGFNATSLAVVFGAMSVGLGFGLQNIFNNFVSGIILLFERPIQVGDIIEIDNLRGTVAKINVRSTVVQTDDNASLIVPNATFMTSNLVNWSFKDQRVRRTIDVGVAYGTNVDKVETLLLDIAANQPGILRKPLPDVIFQNFGGSSLDFRLRFWAHLDVAAATENKVRLAIAREFDKAGIEIPFPQQDLHIRSDFRVHEGNGDPPVPAQPEKSP